jgi:probable HAF family extracellular repeat protein
MQYSKKNIVKSIGAFAILSASTAVQAQVYYSAQQIGGGGTVGTAVNDRGQVVGQNSAGQDFVTGPDGVGVTILASPAGQTSATATAINNRGQVIVGSYVTGPNAIGRIPLSVLPGGNFVTPIAINDSGQVTGVSGYQSKSSSDKTPNFGYAFITGPNGKGLTSLGSLDGSTQSVGKAINNKGQVTGVNAFNEFFDYAFITGPNGVGMQNLPRQVNGVNDPSVSTSTYGINALGQLIGGYSADPIREPYGFLTGPNGIGVTDLFSLYNPYSDQGTAEPYAVNNLGQVVGAMAPQYSGVDAFFYSQGVMKDLNTMIDPAHPLPTGTVLTGASAISNTGKIVASGLDGNYRSTWLLTPCTKSNACGGNIYWRETNGDVLVWYVSGGKVVSTADLGNPGAQWSIAGTGDFMGTGDSDIVWTDKSGDMMIWYVNGGVLQSSVSFGKVSTSWSVAGVADFNGDGKSDILWRNTDGALEAWYMNGKTHASSANLGTVVTTWTIQGTGDVNGDGIADIIWRNNNDGDTQVWLMNGTSLGSIADLGTAPGAWSVSGVADFDGDGKADILWHDASNGNTLIWYLNGGSIASSANARTLPTSWSVAATGDFNGNGKHDILWRNVDGDTVVWDMNGVAISSSINLNNMPMAQWSVVR